MEYDNSAIAGHFDEIADWLEIQNENAFRVRAYRNGAEAIRELPKSIRSLLENGEKLSAVKGIGTAIADKTKELLDTGKIAALEALRERYPATLLKLLSVPGLGAKKVGVLFEQLGIVDLVSLKQAGEAGKIRELKGFGAKTEQSILHGLTIAESAMRRLRIDKVTRIADALESYLKNCKEITKLKFAGSFRRGRETVGDLDILVVASDIKAAMDHFAGYEFITEVLQRGETKMSVRLKDAFQADLRVVPAASWGAALQYFTGSQQHNIRVRQIANDRGLKLNEYGLFSLSDEKKSLPCESEEDVYAHLGLPWIAPELRENRFEFNKDFPEIADRLVNLADIRCDLHMHTNETDGQESLEVMIATAKQHGYTHIAITDHSQRVAMARGLDTERLLRQWSQIDAINSACDDGFWVFKGIECDILENATMDLPDDVLMQADWVLASVHYGQKQSREQITERLLMAIGKPYVSAIAHPTGRLIGKREPYEVDIEAVIEAAVSSGTALEINCSPYRLDLSDIHIMSANSAGAFFTMNTDAHSIDNFGQMFFGITQARRAGLARERIVNTWSLENFRTFLGRKKSRFADVNQKNG